MKKLILLLILLLISTGQALRMKRIAFLTHGPRTARVICADTDHNDSNELIFQTGGGWEFWENRPINQYQLVFSDTAIYPYPPGIESGNFFPYDVGDIDQDSLIDLLGPNVDKPQNPDTIYYIVTTQESPNYTSYPESLSWWYRYSNNFQGDGSVPFYFPPDLDSDNRNEIMFVTSPPLGVVIFENIANNQNVVVWNRTQGIIAWSFAFGDLDLDGHKEFITADGSSHGRVYIYENMGDNQYEPVWIDSVLIPNCADVFSGNDLDGDGKPEFFIRFARWVGGDVWDLYLYMWETTGNNSYERTLIAQIRRVTGGPGGKSLCGDIDGDGIDELVWSVRSHIIVFEATGNNQFQQIWQWTNDHASTPSDIDVAIVNIYDMNKNGYKEIVFGGNCKNSIFEVEAVWLRRPNGGEIFIGDTQEQIRWQKFYPPRCDSLSLFYSLNNGRTYDTIITSLPGADSSYLWTVPDTSSDSCKVKIIAYGPGWQYDESDGVFTISPSGIEEDRLPLTANRLSLRICPNPSKAGIRFQVQGVEGKDLSLKIYNLAGKLVKTFFLKTNKQKLTTFLWDGKDDSGKKLPIGVYVYRLKTTDGISETKEFIFLK